MDKEIISQQFKEIEEKIERLIKVCRSLEATNLELRNTIERLEGELQSKDEAEKSYMAGRDLIRSKIDNLLVKLEDITEV